MKEMIERLKKAGKKLELKPGASQSLIDLSETVLNRVIPDDYVQWLRISNGCEFISSGTIFYGLNTGSKYFSLEYHNSAAFRSNYSLPDDLMIIGKMSFGDLICIDAENGNIVQWDHENDEEFDYWETLMDYLDFECKSDFSDE